MTDQTATSISQLTELYEATQKLMGQTKSPAIHQCLRASLNNIHWALWLLGAEPSFVPDDLTFPDGSAVL